MPFNNIHLNPKFSQPKTAESSKNKVHINPDFMSTSTVQKCDYMIPSGSESTSHNVHFNPAVSSKINCHINPTSYVNVTSTMKNNESPYNKTYQINYDKGTNKPIVHTHSTLQKTNTHNINKIFSNHNKSLIQELQNKNISTSHTKTLTNTFKSQMSCNSLYSNKLLIPIVHNVKTPYKISHENPEKSNICVSSKNKVIRNISPKNKFSVIRKNKECYDIITRNKLVRKRRFSLNLNRLSPTKLHQPLPKSNLQLLARGIKSKYKINKLTTPPSTQLFKPLCHRPTVLKRNATSRRAHFAKKKDYNLHITNNVSQKTNSIPLSDKFINIGGIMYKTTERSLRRQPIKPIPKIRSTPWNSKNKVFNKFNLTNRSPKSFSKKATSLYSDKFINIGGMLYKSTKTTLKKHAGLNKSRVTSTDIFEKQNLKGTIRIKGVSFNVSQDGRSLQRLSKNKINNTPPSRIHIGGLTYSSATSGKYVLTKTHYARKIVRTAKQRSLVLLSLNKRYSKNNQYCMFYNRFGKCNKKERGRCTYIHDPTKIAVCTRFLNGVCNDSTCSFSHKVDPLKMPVCYHFLQTSCSNDKCPYRHVRVNPNAPICPEFINGHCNKGEECKKQHIWECENFNKKGGCPRGRSCPLTHRKVKQKTSYCRIKKKRSRIVPDVQKNLSKMEKRYFINSVDDGKSLKPIITSNTNAADNIALKKARILSKIDKMLSTIKHSNNKSALNQSSIKLNCLSSNVPPIQLKVKPFDGPLPDFIPLQLPDDE